MADVMVDLETMDSAGTAAITAIGAVSFDFNGSIISEFYVKVDLQSSMDAGCTVSGATINWWLTQNEQARTEMATKGIPLSRALDQFSEWLPKGTKLWGNGASFDNTILSHAYKSTGKEQPWKFWDDRCYRTIKNLYPSITLERQGTYHHALHDAKTQAEHLIKIFKDRSK
jgi:DNA polymerase III epsilon subunit-like protein